LPSKHKVLSSNHSTRKKLIKNEKENSNARMQHTAPLCWTQKSIPKGGGGGRGRNDPNIVCTYE
jgi:hypothetical protein